jgi:methylaspartate ammonia-lyase
MNVDPWQLRDKYAPVLLKAISAEEFVKIHLPDIGAETAEALQALLHAQELAQRMYTSATFTNDDLESRQPRYAIACAAAALMLAQRATGRYMADRLLSDLAVVTSKGNSITGMNLLWQMVEEYQLELTE